MMPSLMSSFPHVKLTFVHGTAIVPLIMDLELHYRGAWHRCATVELVQGSQSSRHAPVRLQYEADYAVAHMGARDHRALSMRAPVNLRTRDLPNWPSFLIDLLPQGAARKRIERVNNGPRSDWALLGLGAVNPVGNLRVRPAEARIQRKHGGFELSDMVSRGDEFVEYAHELGATVREQQIPRAKPRSSGSSRTKTAAGTRITEHWDLPYAATCY